MITAIMLRIYSTVKIDAIKIYVIMYHMIKIYVIMYHMIKIYVIMYHMIKLSTHLFIAQFK